MKPQDQLPETGMSIQRVAVIGGGPAGCAIAALLADEGVEVTLFDEGDRPELIVGESTLPAMVPILRRLGIEEKVAETSTIKPGASFVFRDFNSVQFCFTSVEGVLPTYAYNVDRTVFDGLVSERADQAGVRRVERRAGVVSVGDDRLELDEESLAAAGGRQPDLLIDATGRTRLFARTLGVKTEVGPRKDVAHFAHFEDFEEAYSPRGQAIIGVLERGWSWRIPLPGNRTSVGIVLNREAAKKLGDTAEERLDEAVRSEPHLSRYASRARRVTPAMTYTNYQLISERGGGANWFAVGDAFGFVDPMLSPGLLLAMKSATELADGILALRAGTATMDGVRRQHDAEMTRQLRAWGDYIGRYYSGEIFALQRAGRRFTETFNFWPNPAIGAFIERQVGSMAAGAHISRPFNQRLIRFLLRFFPLSTPPKELAIH